MPGHAHVIVATPDGDVSRLHGRMFHRRGETAGASTHLLEDAVRTVRFLSIQFLLVECLVVEHVRLGIS